MNEPSSPGVAAPPLYVVILTWNRPAEVLTCLEAVSRSDYPNLHPVVVDNGSVPPAGEAIGRLWPHVPVLTNAQNLGYAAGNNVGIRYALEQGAHYVLLLNDDVLVEPDTFRHLAAALAEPGVAAAGGKVRVLEAPHLLWAAGDGFFRAEAYPPDDGRFDRPADVEYAVGCCLLLSGRVLAEIGPLAGDLFAVHEEREWCQRARHAGYRIRYVPQAAVRHSSRTSFTSNLSPAYHYLSVRNLLYLLEADGAVPRNWRLARGALMVWRWEAVLIARRGPAKARRLLAATRGALDFALGRRGPPPRV